MCGASVFVLIVRARFYKVYVKQLMNLLAINAAMAPVIKGLCGSRFSVTIYSGYGSSVVGSCLLLKEAREEYS